MCIVAFEICKQSNYVVLGDIVAAVKIFLFRLAVKVLKYV